jgi:ribosomal protein L7Ae-like RNA K-turn-binding protein
MKRKARDGVAATTLRQLGGVASTKASFIRSDARAVVAPAASRGQLKGALISPFEPRWPSLKADDEARMMQLLVSSCVARKADTARARPGVVVGLGAATRRLRQRSLRALVVAKHVPLAPLAHLPVLAQRQGVPLCTLNCSSAQLGQPFGLLRAAVIGLAASEFSAEHELVALMAQVAPPDRLCPWLPAAARHEMGEAAQPAAAPLRTDT